MYSQQRRMTSLNTLRAIQLVKWEKWEDIQPYGVQKTWKIEKYSMPKDNQICIFFLFLKTSTKQIKQTPKQICSFIQQPVPELWSTPFHI